MLSRTSPHLSGFLLRTTPERLKSSRRGFNEPGSNSSMRESLFPEQRDPLESGLFKHSAGSEPPCLLSIKPLFLYPKLSGTVKSLCPGILLPFPKVHRLPGTPAGRESLWTRRETWAAQLPSVSALHFNKQSVGLSPRGGLPTVLNDRTASALRNGRDSRLGVWFQ